MSKFKDVKVGETLTHCYSGFENKDKPWTWDARVTAVSDEIIECKVIVDQPRTMKYNRVTGVCIDGKEFGWLE